MKCALVRGASETTLPSVAIAAIEAGVKRADDVAKCELLLDGDADDLVSGLIVDEHVLHGDAEPLKVAFGTPKSWRGATTTTTRRRRGRSTAIRTAR